MPHINVPRYEAILRKDKDVSESNILSTLEITKIKFTHEASKLKLEILQKTRSINDMLQEKELNLAHILEKQEELRFLEMREVGFDELLQKLFPS